MSNLPNQPILNIQNVNYVNYDKQFNLTNKYKAISARIVCLERLVAG